MLFGGSSRTGAQPTGGEPGGEIKKFFSSAGGRKWYGENSGRDVGESLPEADSV